MEIAVLLVEFLHEHLAQAMVSAPLLGDAEVQARAAGDHGGVQIGLDQVVGAAGTVHVIGVGGEAPDDFLGSIVVGKEVLDIVGREAEGVAVDNLLAVGKRFAIVGRRAGIHVAAQAGTGQQEPGGGLVGPSPDPLRGGDHLALDGFQFGNDEVIDLLAGFLDREGSVGNGVVHETDVAEAVHQDVVHVGADEARFGPPVADIVLAGLVHAVFLEDILFRPAEQVVGIGDDQVAAVVQPGGELGAGLPVEGGGVPKAVAGTGTVVHLVGSGFLRPVQGADEGGTAGVPAGEVVSAMAASLGFTYHRLVAFEEESVVSLIGGEHLFLGKRGLGLGE